jgi:hypothetical protein
MSGPVADRPHNLTLHNIDRSSFPLSVFGNVLVGSHSVDAYGDAIAISLLVLAHLVQQKGRTDTKETRSFESAIDPRPQKEPVKMNAEMEHIRNDEDTKEQKSRLAAHRHRQAYGADSIRLVALRRIKPLPLFRRAVVVRYPRRIGLHRGISIASHGVLIGPVHHPAEALIIAIIDG